MVNSAQARAATGDFGHPRLDIVFLRRTPTPPPFSSINSMPARFNTDLNG